MTFDKWALKPLLRIDEVAQRLSEKAGEKVEKADVLSYALHGYLPLALDIATNTKDVEGRPLERGVWDLVMEGEQGNNSKRQVEHDHRLLVNRANKMDLKSLQGAWVSRGDDRRQLDSRWGDWWESPEAPGIAYPRGTMLGVRREALDALAEKLLNLPSLGDRSKSELVSARWEDVTITFTR